MNEKKFYIYAFVAMLMLNFGLFFFGFMQKPADHDPNERKKKVIAMLHFDEQQAAKYQQLIDAHRVMIREKDNQLRAVKKEFYKYLSDKNENDNKVKDSLSMQIGLIMREMEDINYKHLEGIKTICRPEQSADYEIFVTKISEIFVTPNLPPRRK